MAERAEPFRSDREVKPAIVPEAALTIAAFSSRWCARRRAARHPPGRRRGPRPARPRAAADERRHPASGARPDAAVRLGHGAPSKYVVAATAERKAVLLRRRDGREVRRDFVMVALPQQGGLSGADRHAVLAAARDDPIPDVLRHVREWASSCDSRR